MPVTGSSGRRQPAGSNLRRRWRRGVAGGAAHISLPWPSTVWWSFGGDWTRVGILQWARFLSTLIQPLPPPPPPPGCVLLDVKGDSFPAVVDEIVVSLVKSGHLPMECASPVETLLHKKHHHATGDTTIWDRIKSSAGEGLRRKGGSANAQGGGGGTEPTSAVAHDNSHQAVTLEKRSSQFPLLQENDDNEVISPPRL